VEAPSFAPAHLVEAASGVLRQRLPFVLLGLDSDNGGEFLNAHLINYCREHRLTFSRSRSYWKNDQAHVEQKREPASKERHSRPTVRRSSSSERSS
jgi:hypothetical protein